MSDTYECDNCGACCKHLIIEIEYIDILREPKLRQVTKPFKMTPGETFVDADDNPIENPDPCMAGAMLACGPSHPCPMLGCDNLCRIYPSRPNVCVAFQAGSEQCNDARCAAGLGVLEPKGQP